MHRFPVHSMAVVALCWSAHTFAHDPSHSAEADRFEAREDVRWKAAQPLTWRDHRFQRDPLVRIKLLGINDFHGQLSPRTVGARPAGGAAVLASWLKSASASARDGALIIHAGDHVGASPPNSALLQDEPAISFLNALANEHCRRFQLYQFEQIWLQAKCNLVGTPGNHEFDEGVSELLRLIGGGNHASGPFLDASWKGARLPYVSSNLVWADTGKPVLPPYTVKNFGYGVRIGVIGAVLKETPTIVTPTGVAGVSFLDEATSINAAARELKARGIRTIVVTIHQGIRQNSYEGPTNPGIQNLSGPLVDIVRKLDSEIDVVISGHAHGFTNALVNNDAGHPVLVTQAFSASTAYGDIDLAISRKSGDVVEKTAAIVTTWADQGPGLAPDVNVARLVAAADERVAPLVNRIVGVSATALTRSDSAAGESSLGNLIADAQRIVTGADFAFMNPGGIRADLAAGEVTWGELFTIQPFSNDLVSMDLTGAQVKTLLEQQWLGQTGQRILKTSGLRYTWDAARPMGDRVIELRTAAGESINPTQTYRITVNSFIAAGGDNFLVLTQGTNRLVGPVDLDALVTYVEGLAQPFTAAIEGRIQRVN